MADWSLLPNELVERISTFLDTTMDLLRFCSVCSSWRSSASPNSRALCPSLFSELNYPPLGCLTRCTVFLITPPGSTSPCSNGWLVKINSEEGSPKHLVHPLSQHRLNSLPAGFPRHLDLFNFRILELGQEYAGFLNLHIPTYLKKVVITWLNRGSHFLLLARGAIGILALYESFGKKWTIFNDTPQRYTNDVIAYDEKLYAVYNDGKTVCVGPNAELELIAYPISEGGDKYLVKCRGQLLLVNMYRDTNTNTTCRNILICIGNSTCYVRARVFKLDKELLG